MGFISGVRAAAAPACETRTEHRIYPRRLLKSAMKPFHRILIPTDGSENAKLAAAQGLELARSMNAEVTAMSVADMGSMAYVDQGLAPVDFFTYLEEGAEAAAEQVRQEGERLGVVVKTLVRDGAPANEIINASKDYDLIVMGTLGRTGLRHLLMGSVAEKVVRFASCPVLVVRAPKTE
jgi:nucleotide-binding universal stress UspA family protein